MKMVLVVFMVCFGIVACGEEIEPLKALHKGMPNTVTLSNGEVVYNMEGKWDAVIDYPHSTPNMEDIIRIKQESNKIVGVCLEGNEIQGTGAEIIKGELEKNGFNSLIVNTPYGWLPAKSKIDSSCNKIETTTKTTKTIGTSSGITLSLTLIRK